MRLYKKDLGNKITTFSYTQSKLQNNYIKHLQLFGRILVFFSLFVWENNTFIIFDSNFYLCKKIVMDAQEYKLNARNIKPTAMRELVLKILGEQKAAVSLSDLEHEFAKVDRVTLYRTLKTFEENKLIHSIDDGTGSIKYALCTDNCRCMPEDLHVHFLCAKCKHTFCLNDIKIPTINLPPDFALESINMVIKGVCSDCK
jgi:Fur family transcriptional regulator, ferric uptake regulator